MPDAPHLMVIVPAHNAAWCIGPCLSALANSGFDLAKEVTVVDDGSVDATAQIARDHGATLLCHTTSRGAAAARHTGAKEQSAEVLVFVDADVTVAPDTKTRLQHAFAGTTPAAVFGAYDETPGAPGLISQYRNLLHRYVHLTSAGPAQTFWTGLGAVRRAAYDDVGGIDPDIRMMEDVDLGLRLTRAGHDILLDPAITGTHLKSWTWARMIKTDLFDRAIPWTEMILATDGGYSDLNLTKSRKLAALSALGIATGLVLVPFHMLGLVLLILCLATFTALSWPFLKWLSNLRGPAFAGLSLLPHITHNWCAIAGYGIVRIKHLFAGSPATPHLKTRG